MAASSSAAPSPASASPGRGTQGVIVFDTAEDEKVVSVERITDDGVEDGVDGGPDDEAGDDAPEGEAN